MISKRARSRLSYSLMSILLAWHTTAMLIAPAPKSYLTEAARVVFSPYLEMFGLDNPWDFYAPVVGHGRVFRFTIEDKDGKTHTYTPINDVNWLLPSYWWLTAWYEAIWRTPEIFGSSFIATVCEKYEALRPVSVRLIGIQQKAFTPDDYLNGHQPLDDDFVTESDLGGAQCPEQ
jgi:hypothetical protein